MLFLPQFPLWQCTNTDSCTSSESASEIRLSWPSFIEYSGQPLDRSWTPGQPQLNPSNVNTEYDSASEQSDGSKHSTGEQSIPHTFKIDFKGWPLTKIQNEGNCILQRAGAEEVSRSASQQVSQSASQAVCYLGFIQSCQSSQSNQSGSYSGQRGRRQWAKPLNLHRP